MSLPVNYEKTFNLDSLKRYYEGKLKEHMDDKKSLSELDRGRVERKLSAISDILRRAESESVTRRQNGS